jgi:sterol O-acyltransferase
MAGPRRPSLYAHDTLEATQLKGTLGPNGLAALTPDLSANTPPRRQVRISEGVPRDATAVGPSDESAISDDGDDVDSIEDYDDLQVDPDTLIVDTRKSMDDGHGHDHNMAENEGIRSGPARGQSKHVKRHSIQIRLERTETKGRYVLTADDPDIRDVLRKGLEREEAAASGRTPRTRFRDLIFTRRFTTFDRQNPASAESPFFGFFTLFWICMSLIFVQVALRNWKEYGSFLGGNQVLKMMMGRDLLLLGVTDGVMFAATFETYYFQKLVRRGLIDWSKTGWILQNLWQTAYIGAVVGWTYYREWPWTHTIFVVLHGLVFLMKQHSFAFYNGYLSSVSRRKALLEAKLVALEKLEPLHSPPASPSSPRASFTYPDVSSTGADVVHMSEAMKRRRRSSGPRTSVNLKTEKSDVADVAAAIESGRPINHTQMLVMSNIVQHEIDELARELRGKSDREDKAYPQNLTLGNFAEYVCLPTLVYELEYPRQEDINWWYVAEKTTATFGVLLVMQVISQGFIYPLVRQTVEMKEAGMTLDERWREFPFIVSDMLFPMLIEQLLTWYLIWECILNVLAEVTRFADRGFYGDWWNSVTWDQYARDWNRPVHNFLLRHVYHSSISTFHLSKTAATFVTFLLSALVHEMCMAVMFKKVRGYLFCMQLLQMPLVMFSKSKLMKGRVVLGNILFWLGLFVGPSLLTSLYLVV